MAPLKTPLSDSERWPIPEDEAGRIAVLRQIGLLDTEPEVAFDAIAGLARDLAGAPIALVSLVDIDRQWFKAKLGLDVSQTPREFALCGHAIMHDDLLWVRDAPRDTRFAGSPLVASSPFIRFYAGAPIRVRGQRIGTVCVISDLPRPYDAKLADQLTKLAGLAADECEHRLALHQMDEARREAMSASVAKSQFLANMSHELRTPLNGVIGVASVLEKSVLDTEQLEMVRIIRKSGEGLTALLNDVLDISKIEAERFDLELAAFRMDEVIKQSMDLFRGAASAKGLVLTLEGATGGCHLGDAARIGQILSNLISNAVKFTETGSIRVRVRAQPLSDGDRVEIDVADTGPGFSAAFSERLFGRFEQGDGSLTRRHGGTGLGLAISRALAEKMGGSLTAAGSPGHGACFTLRLDLQSADATSLDSAGSMSEAFTVDGLRILIAEDNPVNRRVQQLILGAVGADVTLVEDGQEAVDAFVTEHFDFVLMDVQMPVMDGLEAIRRIRAYERDQGLPRTPINTLSAHASAEHVQLSLAAGADDHLTKPISAEILMKAIVAGLRTHFDADEAPLSRADPGR